MTKNQQTLAKIGGASLALLLSLGLGQQASAFTVTLVENLGQGTSGSSSVSFGNWQGTSFTTGSGSYKLESATLLFQQNTASPNLFVRLYSNNSGKPGTQLASFTSPASITTELNENIFTLTTPQALTPNTTYWLIGGVSSVPGDYDWGIADSFDKTGLPGWTIGDGYAYSNDQGLSWGSDSPALPYQFSVNGTEEPVPEPLTILGTGVVLGAIPALKKEYGKRKKKKDQDA